MSTTTIRGGKNAVSVSVDEQGVRIDLGPDGISASVALDFGEARLLAETILEEVVEQLASVQRMAFEEVGVFLPSMMAGIPDGIWRVVQGDDRVEFHELGRRERDLVILTNPMLWPMGDRIPVKRWRPNPPPAPKAMPGYFEFGIVRRDRGPSIWDGADLVESFEDFEAMVDAGWVVD